MIEVGRYTLDLGDTRVLAGLAGLAVTLLVVLLLIAAVRAAGRSARAAETLPQQIAHLGHRVQALSDGQHQLAGGLSHVGEAQATAQTQMLTLMEQRLTEVSAKVNEQLQGSSTRTARSLGELQQRLATIDKAQENIEKLSGDVLSLQDILSNKQRRGMFGEIQLNDIVSQALPADAYSLQTTLSNGRRADCLVKLPNPPGSIVIDAKFPFEAFEMLAAAESKEEQARALRAFGAAVKEHINAISSRYIVEGETADGALMFLPSEAVYAELHARLPEVVRYGFEQRVWIVSPTTCMATLNTMRAILKDLRMREQAGAIRKALRQLHRDVEIIGEKAGKLETHLRQAGDDVAGVLTATTRAGKRAGRLDNFDFEELAPDTDGAQVVPLRSPEA
ncbi:MAG: DNA recombination protein RmuC [Rhodobacteraceae bacterium]|nr:DNA recombination protein RmuC [Paracoccaceae bacterium]